MFTVVATSFGAFWSVLTTSTTDRPSSPLGEAPKLVYLNNSSESLLDRKAARNTRRDSTCPLLSSDERAELDSESDIDHSQTIKSKPRKQRFKKFMASLKTQNTISCRYAEPDACERLAHHCTLCRREIPPTHFYASRPKKIQQDNTYISTRCCHQTVHSPCYRITLQYFIDSKGRPRCPICRNYPDLFVACWSLGYVFDKDVGDIDDEECECGENIKKVCDVCQGRKQLLRDLQGLSSGAPMNVCRQASERDLQKELKLCTIIEVDDER